MATALLTACGGGSGGAAPTVDPGTVPAPAPDPTPTLKVSIAGPSQLRFDWSGGQNVTEYRLLESADGTAAPVQVETFLPTDQNHNRNVFLPARVNARYVLQACNLNGCIDSKEVVVLPGAAPVAKRALASVPGDTDHLGISIALSGDGTTLAVGSEGEDSDAAGSPNAARDSGAVYVYTWDGQQWVQQARLKAANAGGDDRFGTSLALSADGNTLAVGAPQEDSNGVNVNDPRTNNFTSDAGAVYVFTRSNGNWTQQAYVKASNTFTWWEGFGRKLALSGDGNTLAVGSQREDSDATGVNNDQSNDGATDSGAVYVYRRSGTTWAPPVYLKASNTDSNDQFGSAVALNFDGSILAVGAIGESSSAKGIGGNQDDDTAAASGAVYLFTLGSTGWAQQAYIKASNTGAGDQFGTAVGLSKDGLSLAVSAVNESSRATGVNGEQNDDQATASGAVYVFTSNGSTWTQQAYLKASNTGNGDNFGASLSISADGNLIAAGAGLEDSNAIGIGGEQNDLSDNSGAAYVFARNGGRWAQQAYVKASADVYAPASGLAQPKARFGTSVDFADDGSALGIGAYFEDHSGLPEPGAAYTY